MCEIEGVCKGFWSHSRPWWTVSLLIWGTPLQIPSCFGLPCPVSVQYKWPPTSQYPDMEDSSLLPPSSILYRKSRSWYHLPITGLSCPMWPVFFPLFPQPASLILNSVSALYLSFWPLDQPAWLTFCFFSFFPPSGNKGAVGVSFMFNGTSLGFVNSHLTSGSEKKLR